MSKVITVNHLHKFADGGADQKLIGSVTSRKKALDIVEKYKQLEGFCDSPEGFFLIEVELDCLREEAIGKLLKELNGGG